MTDSARSGFTNGAACRTAQSFAVVPVALAQAQEQQALTASFRFARDVQEERGFGLAFKFAVADYSLDGASDCALSKRGRRLARVEEDGHGLDRSRRFNLSRRLNRQSVLSFHHDGFQTRARFAWNPRCIIVARREGRV